MTIDHDRDEHPTITNLRLLGRGQDIAAAQRLAAFAAEYEVSNPPSMLTDSQIDDLVKHRTAEYQQARDVLAAQKAMPKPRILTQQDEQLNMAYRNGFEDGAVLGRMAMLRLVCKVAIGGLAAAMLAAFIILG